MGSEKPKVRRLAWSFKDPPVVKENDASTAPCRANRGAHCGAASQTSAKARAASRGTPLLPDPEP